MSTPDQPGFPHEKKAEVTSPFSRLYIAFQSIFSFVIERKKALLALFFGLLFLTALLFFWMERVENEQSRQDSKAHELVQQLRSPVLGEKQAPLPPYKNIADMLSSSTIQERYNGVLLQEAIVAEEIEEGYKMVQKVDRIPPFQSWPWNELPLLAKLLEEKKYDKALTQLQSLEKTIHQRKKEQLFPELLGYLYYMKVECLKETHQPEAQALVELEGWKKNYPDLNRKLFNIVTIEK